jgi:hypothetical protein
MSAELAPLLIDPREMSSRQSFTDFVLAHTELGTERKIPFGTEQSVDVPAGTTSGRAHSCLVGGIICND